MWLVDFRDEEFEHWEEYESEGESWEEDWISNNVDYDEYCAGPSNHTNHVGDSVPNLTLDSPLPMELSARWNRKHLGFLNLMVIHLLNQ